MTFAEQFLQKIWDLEPGPFGEIRTIGNGRVKQFWIPLPLKHGSATRIITEEDTFGRDVYFGVLPRMDTSGTSEDISNLQSILWADFDGKDYKFAAFDRMMRVRPVPQIVIDSGYGYHAYWILHGSVSREVARQIMRGMSIAHKSDHTYDAARVLRVPGTNNHKNGLTVAVRPIKFDFLAPHYTPSDFSEYQYVGWKAEQPVQRTITTIPGAQQNLPDWLQDLVQFGGSSGDRSLDGWRVCLAGIERGYSKDAIEQWFMDNSNGIGQKYHERGMGSRWFNVTFSNALRTASSKLRTA